MGKGNNRKLKRFVGQNCIASSISVKAVLLNYIEGIETDIKGVISVGLAKQDH